MRLFAPARAVTAPDGCEWKIYVVRTQLPAWRPLDYDPPPPAFGPAALVFAAVDLIQSLIFAVLHPLVRVLVGTPLALIRSSTSRRRRIEAVTLWPHEERYVWEADAADVAVVVAEVADALGAGKFAQPTKAIFRGREL